MKPAIIIIYGPTASGKSQLALALAQAFDGVVINADSMQLYRELRILTARPTEEEEALVPHRLYGVLPASEASSAGRWLDLVAPEIDRVLADKKLPILVGGTGMYLKSLMEGIAPIPAVDPEVRSKIIKIVKNTGPEALHDLLKTRDPEMAARLRPSDVQRLIRAYEVIENTGKSLASWQNEESKPVISREKALTLAMDIPRGILYERCNARFAAMVKQGAVEEVKRLLALDLPERLPAMKAVGVPEIARVLLGEWSLEQAVEKAQQATRNYAKRQVTWMRHQFEADEVVPHDWAENSHIRQKTLDFIGKAVDRQG